MPIFRYKCKSCDTEQRQIVTHIDEAVSCSLCGSLEMAKLAVSSIAVGNSSKSSCANAKNCPASHCCNGQCGCGR